MTPVGRVCGPHTEDCEEFAYFYHAATGGDSDCKCRLRSYDMAYEYLGVLWGTSRNESEDDALLTAAEELGLQLGDYVSLKAMADHA